MRRKRSSKVAPIIVGVLVLVVAAVLLYRVVLSKGIGPSPVSTLLSRTTPTPAEAAPLQAARQFFDLWDHGQYERMYDMLSEASQSETPKERFVARYRNITSGVGITSIRADFRPELPSTSPKEQQTSLTLPYTITMQASRLGEFGEDNELPLVLEGGEWRIRWSPSLIFKGLTADKSVRLLPDDSVRGEIVDRKGRMLAGPGKVLSIGVIPGAIKDEGKVLIALSTYLEMSPEVIKARYANANPDWWVPLRDLPMGKLDEAKSRLGSVEGIAIREKDARVYPYGSVAAHVLGYVSQVNAEDLKRLGPKGYEESDVVGRAGLEASMEDVLAGEKGGRLVIVDQNGGTARTIAQREAKPGGRVELAIDVDVQKKAEEALGDKTGSIVVIDPRDHSVLALVSHPAYDPNAFVLGLSEADWKKLSEDPRLPFQDRPTLSAYPTGSVFKVVTMAAGLEKGGYTPESLFNSPGQWTLPGTNQVFGDWLPQGHGQLNLMDGLAQSANPVFYEIGYKLNSLDPNLLPDFAREFGLGAPVGLVGLPEAAGTVPSPEWKMLTLKESWYPGDAVNLAIGQGYLEATPLQIANLYAALADEGHLRTPLLIKRVVQASGEKEFASDPDQDLPISAATRTAIREGMKRAAADPKGTANYAFKGFSIPTAAKTGSAENQNPDAHAWFAGYAPVDNPEVVVVVMVEGGRAGGEVAAPLARNFLEGYFKPPQ